MSLSGSSFPELCRGFSVLARTKNGGNGVVPWNRPDSRDSTRVAASLDPAVSAGPKALHAEPSPQMKVDSAAFGGLGVVGFLGDENALGFDFAGLEKVIFYAAGSF